MSLQKEIEAKAKEIQVDGYPMSIGELVNMYQENELRINPNFQRFFRWSDYQKTKLIESILLGIPIPPIFVSHGDDGWDVIDGLQRLSTIFEFMGVLCSPEGDTKAASRLQGTKFLPSLEGKFYNNQNDAINSFTQEQRFILKRSKFDIRIIKKTSDKDAKYELFQRINTGGANLTPQEIRNCLIIMVDQSFYEWTSTLGSNPDFENCISISEKMKLEQYNMEVLMRYLVSRYIDMKTVRGSEDIGEFITESIMALVNDSVIDREHEKLVFEKTFALLNETLGDDSFRKYDRDKQKFKGPFLMAAFECIASGVSYNIAKGSDISLEALRTKVEQLYTLEQYNAVTGRGTARPIMRMKELIELGWAHFDE